MYVIPHVLEPSFVLYWLKGSNKVQNDAFETKQKAKQRFSKHDVAKTTWEFVNRFLVPTKTHWDSINLKYNLGIASFNKSQMIWDHILRNTKLWPPSN